MTRRTPASLAASRTLSVPVTFTSLELSGSWIERGHRRQRGLVEDDVAALDGREHTLEAAEVALHDLDVLRDVEQVAPVARREVVEDADIVAALEQRVDQMRPDEPGAAGDEHPRHGPPSRRSAPSAPGRGPLPASSPVASRMRVVSAAVLRTSPAATSEKRASSLRPACSSRRRIASSSVVSLPPPTLYALARPARAPMLQWSRRRRRRRR